MDIQERKSPKVTADKVHSSVYMRPHRTRNFYYNTHVDAYDGRAYRCSYRYRVGGSKKKFRGKGLAHLERAAAQFSLAFFGTARCTNTNLPTLPLSTGVNTKPRRRRPPYTHVPLPAEHMHIHL